MPAWHEAEVACDWCEAPTWIFNLIDVTVNPGLLTERTAFWCGNCPKEES